MKYWFVLSIVAFSQFAFAEPITLMTFNIRYGTADDGENSWEFRKEHVVETIKNSNPAVIAIQEALLGQLEYVMNELSGNFREKFWGYKKIGEHRNGNTKGEFSGLLIDPRTIEVLSSGQIWLSPTPDEVGSVGWDATITRTATWITARRVGTSSPKFIVVGTHFDHRGKEARLESAKLIVAKVNELADGKQVPVVIMGDMNCIPESEPFNVFKGAGFRSVVDSGEGTFHKFSGKTVCPQLDYIFLSDTWTTKNAEILRPRKDGKPASDHDPVVADVLPRVPRGTIGMARSIAEEWIPSQDSLVSSLIPEELQENVERTLQVITTRPDTEPDYHELSHVYGAFKFPMHLPELAGDLTDRLMALHCEPSNIRELSMQVLDTKPSNAKTEFVDRPTVEQVMEFLAIPNKTFYIEQEQLSSALEVINYSTQVDFDALVATITIPTGEKQPFFGKAMPPGVTGSVLAGQMGPDGWRVVGGEGPNTYDMTLIAEVFDLGGNDTYFANGFVVGNRKVVDLGGNDTYTGTEQQGPAAGLFGTWIIDDRSGDDTYGTIGGQFSTGTGCFGVGMIIDRGGNDSYRGTQWSIGAGVYGVGIVLDLGEGDDEYLGEFLSIGVGGPRGFGFVFDERGDELYQADGPKPSVYDVEGVHASFSQGMGFGYRKYAAGGIGILCDIEGDDTYEAGEFSQGGAYYHGLGILRDFSGDDNFLGNRYAQGFGVHQAFGVLIDDAGDDNFRGSIAINQGAGWDIAAGCLLDKSGNDSYEAGVLAQGSAAQQAIGYLIDLQGNDSYSGAHPAQGESGSNSYHWDATHAFSFSLLLDEGGGDDSYSLGGEDNTIVETNPNPKPAGDGIGLLIDR
jgi:endonuclease/exonuclease/phosphatase family metal-dependent hydrolase